jgi:glycosyltransferase involved in cell wall biosynthesis
MQPITFFLPAHDEAQTVAGVLGRIPHEVAGHPVVRVVVDDGSSDATATEAEAAGAAVVRHCTRRGLGAAVRTGLRAAVDMAPAAVVFCDADGEYRPEEVERLVAPILDGNADYVVGSRFAGHIETMQRRRRAGNVVLTAALSRLLHMPITDGQSGYRALSPRAAAAARIGHDYNYAQVLTIEMVRYGFRYAEVPITYRFRERGRSFVRLLPYLTRVVPAVARELTAPRAPSVQSVFDDVAREPLLSGSPRGAIESA